MVNKSIIYPPSVVTSGNEVLLAVSVQNAYVAAGTAQIAYLWLLSYNHVAGDKITLSWAGNSEEFICVANYNYEPNTYPLRITETISAWGERVFNALISNRKLLSDFIIRGYPQAGDYLISFEPYEKIASNNMTVAATTLAPIGKQNSSYTSDELYEDFRLRIQLMRKLSGSDGFQNMRSPVFIPFIFDGINAALSYDISKLLYSDQTGHFTFPEAAVKHLQDILSRYYLQLTFMADNISDESPVIDHSVIVLPGKLSETKEKALNTANSSIYADLVSSKRFLTFAPTIKQTDLYAPEKLYFLFLAAYQNARILITERFTNSVSETRTLDTFLAAQYSLYEFSIGFQQIKQADYGSKILSEYDIWIDNGSGSPISEIRTFRMDYTYQRTARYFLFKNSLGMYELFRSTGDASKSNKITKEFYNRVIHGKKDSDQSRKLIDVQHTYSMKVNSGYLEDPWNFYLASELLGSHDVFWLRNDRAYAVQIEEGDTEISETDLDNLHNFDFIVTLDDMDDTFFTEFRPGSELPVLGDFNNDFNDDFYV